LQQNVFVFHSSYREVPYDLLVIIFDQLESGQLIIVDQAPGEGYIYVLQRIQLTIMPGSYLSSSWSRW